MRWETVCAKNIEKNIADEILTQPDFALHIHAKAKNHLEDKVQNDQTHVANYRSMVYCDATESSESEVSTSVKNIGVSQATYKGATTFTPSIMKRLSNT